MSIGSEEKMSLNWLEAQKLDSCPSALGKNDPFALTRNEPRNPTVRARAETVELR